MCDKEDNIISYIIASNKEDFYHIHRIFIIPELRKRLTFILIRHAIKIAKKNEFNMISWRCGEGIKILEESFRIADKYDSLGKINGYKFYTFYKDINDINI